MRNRTGGFAAVAATQARGRISRDDIELSKNASFSGIYIQEFISAEDSRRYNFRASFCFEIFRFPLLPRNLSGQLIGKVKDQAERVISTPELNMLPCLHPEPINVVVYHDPSGRSHLGIGLALRCFQRLSFPDIAAQHCR